MDVIDGSVDVFSFPMNGTAIGYQRCVIIIEFLFFLGGGESGFDDLGRRHGDADSVSSSSFSSS